MFYFAYLHICMYQWRAVAFHPGDAVEKSTLNFLKFYFNHRFFLQISPNTASFSLFFKFKIRLKKNILEPWLQTDTALCEGE